MGGRRLARVAESHALGAWRAVHRFRGVSWFVFAGYLGGLTAVFAAAGRHSASGPAVVLGGMALFCLGAGVQIRRRKAVHLFEEGVVLVGVWGQAKVVGRWSEVTVWTKRTMRNGSRQAYGVATGGRARFGFGERQVANGPQLGFAMTEAAAAGHRRALDETGTVTYGAEVKSDPLGPLRVTAERIYLDQHGRELLIADIRRVWIATLPFRGKQIRILNVTMATEPPETTMLSFRPADLTAAGELIASVAGKKLEHGEE